MGFHEVRFADDISYGSSGGPGFSTNIVRLDSGAEVRIPRWSSGTHRYNVAYGLKSQAQVDALKAFYLARMGATHGFRYKDFSDFSTGPLGVGTYSPTDVVAINAAADGTTFQLVKKYVSGPTTVVRTITKPVSGAVRVAVNNVERMIGVAVDTTTGIVTLSPGYLSGDVVTWGGEFDVPVRFEGSTDQILSATIEDYSNRNASVELIEIKAGIVSPEEKNFGGSREIVATSDFAVGFGTGRVQVVTTTSSGLNALLPDPATIEPLSGGVFFTVFNDGPTHALNIKDHTGNTLVSVPTGQAVEICISRDSSGTPYWYSR